MQGLQARTFKARMLMAVKCLRTLILCALQANGYTVISFNHFDVQWRYLVWKTRIALTMTFYHERFSCVLEKPSLWRPETEGLPMYSGLTPNHASLNSAIFSHRVSDLCQAFFCDAALHAFSPNYLFWNWWGWKTNSEHSYISTLSHL